MVVKLLLIPFLLQNTNLLFTTIMRWFEMMIVYFVGKLADYWVVKTFYTNYSVVYDCTQLLNDDKTCKTVISWVFSRHPNLSDDLMVEVGHVTEFLCLNETQFYTTTHTHGNASSFFEGMHYFFLSIINVLLSCANR